MVQEAHKPLRSFGRIKSRRLHNNAQRLMDEVLPKITFKELPKDKDVWLEIGFGGGEHLAHQAKSNPNIFHVGFEPFINGTAKLLREVEEHKLDNVAVHNGDAREVIEKLPDNSVTKVFILFPDPWPKARHHKRRIIQENLLDMLARVLKPGGVVRAATDHAGYGEWILDKFASHKQFELVLNTHEAPADHILTKYQQKGLAGHNPIFLEFCNIK